MNIRLISAPLLALVVGFALFASEPAIAQTGTVLLDSSSVIGVPATDQQLIRVTVGNPRRSSSGLDGNLQISDLTSVAVDPVTIKPGESFMYTLDPRDVGVIVDPNSNLRHVRVGIGVSGMVVDPSDPNSLRPVILLEFLNRNTGKLESFRTFPGFSGGVTVAAGDVN